MSDIDEIDAVQDTVITIILVTNSLSGFTAFLMILSYFKFKELQTFAFRIVLFLNLSDFFLAIGNMMLLITKPPDNKFVNMMCMIQSYIVNSFQLSSIIWTAIIAYVIYQSAVKSKNEATFKDGVFIFFGFILPLILSFYPFFTDDYGFQGIGCWIKQSQVNSKRGIIVRFINFYIPLMIIILYNSMVYIYIILKLFGITQTQWKFIYKMISYPLILIICWVLTAFNKTYIEITQETNLWLLFSSKALAGLMGFFNYLGYGFTKEDQVALLCCIKRNKTQSLELEAHQHDVSTNQRNSIQSDDSNERSSRGNSFINELI